MNPDQPLSRSLRFLRGARPVEVTGVPADRTLLQLLRDDLHCTAVKEGCASGDCGACTVTVAEAGADGRLHYRAINSCIRLAHSVDGMAVWTAADIAAADGTLHPAQRAMVECHGSQCGFCTPGFVMSLFTLHRRREGAAVTRDDAVHALSGNLCRCTGYRPILDAAETMHHWPDVVPDESWLLQQLKLLAQESVGPEPDLTQNFYLRPATLDALLQARAAQPDALLAAGTTDIGLWLTKQLQRRPQIIDVTGVAELRRVQRTDDALIIGAAVTLNDAFAALAAERPALGAFFDRFAGLPVRESGTLGGNVANGSPIGDSMPLLIALGATLTLASVRGERTLPIEDFYLAYRQTALAPDEVLRDIRVPHPSAHEWLRVDKVSKRLEDDISAVCLAVALQVDEGRIRSARIGAGGVAATPARATKTEAACAGQTWAEGTFEHAAQCLEAEFEPLSDMRASADYRRVLLGNLLRRAWAASADRQAAPALADLQPEQG